jgi:pimeloyl-ACP methyl ester carboxylesterase
LWITGGDCNSIDEIWSPAPRENDQTAAAYRNAGIVMMFPSLRGGNNNPGEKESFLGEVDDVLAAADQLEQVPYVDSDRIYLGGHSTGGTLVLLVAECSDRFRAVFSFGPAADVSGYGDDFLLFNKANPQEVRLRSPAYWLDSIKSPVFVLEGTSPTSNIVSLRAMARISKNASVHFLEVPSVNHFSILAPANEVISKKILQDPATLSLSAKDFDVANSQ